MGEGDGARVTERGWGHGLHTWTHMARAKSTWCLASRFWKGWIRRPIHKSLGNFDWEFEVLSMAFAGCCDRCRGVDRSLKRVCSTVSISDAIEVCSNYALDDVVEIANYSMEDLVEIATSSE